MYVYEAKERALYTTFQDCARTKIFRNSNNLLIDTINVQSVMVHFDHVTVGKKLPLTISKYIRETFAENNQIYIIQFYIMIIKL